MQESECPGTTGLAAAVWQVLRSPDRLPHVLRALLSGEVFWDPPWSTDGPPVHDRACPVLRLRDPTGGWLRVARTSRRFTFCERLAAHLLVRMACRPRFECRRSWTMRLADGTPLRLRPSTQRDLPAVTALHALCRPQPCHPGDGFPEREDLAHLLHPRVGCGALAEDSQGRPVGWASLAWDGDQADAVLLSHPAWRERGLPTVLLRHLAETADQAGCRVLWLPVAGEEPDVHETVADLGLPWTIEVGESGARAVVLRLETPTFWTADEAHTRDDREAGLGPGHGS